MYLTNEVIIQSQWLGRKNYFFSDNKRFQNDSRQFILSTYENVEV